MNTFKIIRDNTGLDEIVKFLTEQKDNVKDVMMAVRLRDGSLHVLHEDVPFETLCVISKKLDLIIDGRQMDEFAIEFTQDDEDAEEEE